MGLGHIKVNVDAKVDLTKPLETLTACSTKGAGKVLDCLWGKRLNDVYRDRALTAAQTQKDVNDILEGKSRYDGGEVLSLGQNTPLALHYDYVTRQEHENLAATLEMVAQKVQELDDKEVSDEPVESGWFLRWRREAMCVGRPELQNLLAGLLAENIKNTSTISLRTLDIAKNLTGQDSKDFDKIVPFILNGRIIPIAEDSGCRMAQIENRFVELEYHYPPGIDYSLLLRLQQAGLLLSSTRKFIPPKIQQIDGVINSKLTCNGYTYFTVKISRHYYVWCHQLTDVGIEILKASMSKMPTNNQIEWTARCLSKVWDDIDYTYDKYNIIVHNPDGSIVYDTRSQ